MKKKKKKKKTGFDPDALDAGDSGTTPEPSAEEPVPEETNTSTEQTAEKVDDDGEFGFCFRINAQVMLYGIGLQCVCEM